MFVILAVIFAILFLMVSNASAAGIACAVGAVYLGVICTLVQIYFEDKNYLSGR